MSLLGVLVAFAAGLSAIFTPLQMASAQQTVLLADTHETVKAKVVEIIRKHDEFVAGTSIPVSLQDISVQILEGQKKGQVVTVENDHLILEKGDTFYLLHTIDTDGTEYYSVQEHYRLPQVLFFVALFLVAALFFGGIQGLRGLLSLIGSFLLILYVLLPGVLHGYSPVLVTTIVASIIIVFGSYVTHGFNKTTSSAVIGMIVTVLFTGLLAYIAVHWAKLSGFESEESVYLNINTGGTIDFQGLLLGGIMIGLLGVLYDVAIGQAISVEELHRVAPHVPKKTIYQRAIRMGREHIGALVNTLAIAYVGAALPLLLYFYISDTSSVATIANREIFSAEIIRTMIGSIGLILAVPITTLISVAMLLRKGHKDRQDIRHDTVRNNDNVEEIKEEMHRLEELSHKKGCPHCH